MNIKILNSTISLFILATFFSSCAKDIVDLTGNISGTVKDYSGGQFIENCKVSLSPGGKSTTTSSNGVYEFNDLQPGDYTLSFSKAGYNDESTNVSVVAGQTSNVSAMLKAKSAFALSETLLDFGDLETNKIFYAFNNSDADCSFTIKNSPSWLHLSQERGIVKAGSSESISATIDRKSVDYGDHSQTLNVDYSGKASGSVSLIVRFTKVQLTAPKVSIADKAENITQNSFDVKGTIDATGGSPITSYGHCWSTSENPTVNDSKTALGSTMSTGSFTSNITNLATFTTYYVRAYATNDQGTTYSQQISVTTQDVESDKWDGNIATSFAGGKGTSVDPYQIKTGGQLLLIKEYKDKYFELTGNINLDNHNWLPIENFKGMIDGKGYIISNLKIERTGDNIGLFGSTDGATIKNITIKGVNISAGESNKVGALVGRAYSTTISGCSVYLINGSKIYGKSGVGGIAGSSYGDVFDCSVNSVTSEASIMGISEVGGVVGTNDYYSCKNCKASVDVKADKCMGGIIGSSSGEIISCSFKGKITGVSTIGGITGKCTRLISQCSSDIHITVENEIAGGILGLSESSVYTCKIQSCYSKGEINASGNVSLLGGIIGVSQSTGYIYHSYSTITSSSQDFVGFGSQKTGYGSIQVSESATISNVGVLEKGGSLKNCSTGCENITQFMRECYSTYASDWNFDNTWTWEGTIDGKDVKVSCPKLACE